MSDLPEGKLPNLERENDLLAQKLSSQTHELEALQARFARYETALRGSQVIVYTQDRDLRFTSISNGMLGRSVEDILGRTDEQILPPACSSEIVALKRKALDLGQILRAEFAVPDRSGVRWQDLHVEPLRDKTGAIVGLTCVAVDVTERKEAEAHLRLLLRELTHRSKNLLAVIQAMARQTARHSGSIDGFLSQFGARLQALASSHDLLVRESWHGASLGELVSSQLAAYVGEGEKRIVMDGPEIALKPEAAQNLGLALHELAVNAQKFGALSVPEGRISIRWTRNAATDANAVDLHWIEQFGPKVKMRRKRGFGSLVIERNLARSLDAKVDLAFDPDGVRCHIVIPANQVLAAL